MVSPPLNAETIIPTDYSWDEWYVLDGKNFEGCNETFVNDVSFQLEEVENIRQTMHSTWCESHLVSLQKIQKQFWRQMQSQDIESYVCNHDFYVIVSKKQAIY